MLEDKKIAIVHDWLPLVGGAEMVLKEMLVAFPQAELFTLFDFLTDAQKTDLGIKKIHVSKLNKLPKVQKYYRHLLPLCTMAIEDFDLSEFDIVLSSSHVVAKGALTGAQQLHISYVHSPARYAWDMMHHYLKQAGLTSGIKGFLAKRILHQFRIWDLRTVNGVDVFLANSNYIKRRIQKVYRRDAITVYPPVDVTRFAYTEEKEDFYLTASRMVPYKRIDLIAQTFAQMSEKKLVIIGDGPEMKKIRAIAEGCPNIQLLGYQPNNVLLSHMQRAKAFIFAAEEDFGIVPVEAQACGTPVIAYGAGGALETVRGFIPSQETHATGVHFAQQTTASMREAVELFERHCRAILPQHCRAHAEQFSKEHFRNHMIDIVHTHYQQHCEHIQSSNIMAQNIMGL